MPAKRLPRILLSIVPNSVIKQIFMRDHIHKWMYLGWNDRIISRLPRILPEPIQQIDYSKELYSVSSRYRGDFIRMIDDISITSETKKEWLFSVPAVKNPYASNLFLNICYFFVLEECVKNDEPIDLILVDSPALCSLISKYFPGQFRYSFLNYFLVRIFDARTLVKSVLRFLKYLIDFSRRFVAAKIVFKDRATALLKDKKKIVFLRNYIAGDFQDNDQDIIERHYFPDLYSHMQGEGLDPVFLPIPVQTPSFRKLFRKVKQSKKNIFFAEEFLNVSDYIYTFLAPLRALMYNIQDNEINGYNLKKLIKEEYFDNLTESGLLYSCLLSCFGK